ncbi:MAG: cbb3-type cytochrome c oxidase N-terminal domain-containing protein [Sphingobacteriales bacterium]
MKYIRIILLIGLSTLIQPVFAEDDHSLLSPSAENYLGYGIIVAMLVLFIVAMLVILRAIKVLTRIILKSEGLSEEEIATELKPAKAKKGENTTWLKLLSLKPMSEEKDLLMEHEFDGIQELDNPTPAWFMYLFYATIAIAVGYLLTYHVFRLAPLQYSEYKIEMAQADAANKAYLAKAGNMVDETTVKLSTDPAVLANGKTVFMTNCLACHGAQGQGMIGLGPNLTDDYWLHGGKITDVFKTIKYGVAGKTMPVWGKQISAKQISDVANYVKSLRGTNPPNAKAPEGTKEAN